MSRMIATFAILSFALALASAAPAPEIVRPPIYYPTKVGAKWVCTDEFGRDRSFSVTEVEDKEGAKIVTVSEEMMGGKVLFEVMAVSEKGLFKLQAGEFKNKPPLYELRLPIKVGNKWDWTIPSQPRVMEYKGTRTVQKEETVTVPAGTYSAIPVVFEGTRAGRPYRYTSWYASNVGLVKKRVDQGNREMVLKSFTPAP
jgi:hypothetical protein